MTESEAVDLVNLATQVCPAMKLEERTIEAWYLVLGEYPMADCVAALRAVGARQTWIAPADIATAVREERRDRLDRANLVYEPRDGESVAEQHRRLAAMRHQAASGRALPSQPALALVAGSGAPAPDEVVDMLGPLRAALAARSRVLAVACPWCGAQPRTACEIPGTGRPLARAAAHDARVQVAADLERAARGSGEPQGGAS